MLIKKIDEELARLRKDLEQKSSHSNSDIEEFYDKVYSLTDKLDEDSIEYKPIYDVPTILWEKKIETTDNIVDYSISESSEKIDELAFIENMSEDSRKSFNTAEKIYKILIDEDIDWVVVIAPYSKAIEIELFNRIIRKFEAWNNSKGYKLKEFDEKIRNYSKITIGQLLFLLQVRQFKEFINESFNKTTISFLSSKFRDQLSSLNKLRNPFIHKKTAGYEIVESFRKIMIYEGFMMNLIQIN